MADNNDTPTPAPVAPAPTPPPAPAPVIEIELSEFCRRLSESVRKPELIAGFEHVQTNAGNFKSTEAAYRAAFDEFVNAPA
jgi:hypothetical protein